MPELPEVEVVRAGVQRLIAGASLSDVSVPSVRVARRLPGGGAELAAALNGATVVHVDRRGKFMWWTLHNPAWSSSLFSAVVHLGMSGQVLVMDPQTPAPRHTALSALVQGAGEERIVRFVDQRTFGSITLSDLIPDPHGVSVSVHPHGIPQLAAHIAPDPLEEGWDCAAVVRRARRRSAAVKSLLLDQNLVSGIGNIYADEALWASRVHPSTAGEHLSVARWTALLQASGEVMRAALAQGGTSFDALYVNVNGASGYFDRSLHAYARTAQPCHRCSVPLRRLVIGGRSSHFCPRCQVKARARTRPGLA